MVPLPKSLECLIGIPVDLVQPVTDDWSHALQDLSLFWLFFGVCGCLLIRPGNGSSSGSRAMNSLYRVQYA